MAEPASFQPSDDWTDQEFETHLRRSLRHEPGLARTGWPALITAMRRARLDGRYELTETDIAEMGRLETGHGHEDFTQIRRGFALARRLLPDSPEWVRSVMEDAAYHRFVAARLRSIAYATEQGETAWVQSDWPTIAAYARAHRELRAVPLIELTRQLGVSVDTLRYMERGAIHSSTQRMVTVDELRRPDTGELITVADRIISWCDSGEDGTTIGIRGVSASALREFLGREQALRAITAETPGTSLGELLRLARERSGLDTDTVSERLKNATGKRGIKRALSAERIAELETPMTGRYRSHLDVYLAARILEQLNDTLTDTERTRGAELIEQCERLVDEEFARARKANASQPIDSLALPLALTKLSGALGMGDKALTNALGLTRVTALEWLRNGKLQFTEADVKLVRKVLALSRANTDDSDVDRLLHKRVARLIHAEARRVAETPAGTRLSRGGTAKRQPRKASQPRPVSSSLRETHTTEDQPFEAPTLETPAPPVTHQATESTAHRLSGIREAMKGATEAETWRQLGLIVQATRELRQKTRREFAAVAGIHPSCLEEIEDGLGYDDGFMYPGPATDELKTADLREVTARLLPLLDNEHNPGGIELISADDLAGLQEFVAAQRKPAPAPAPNHLRDEGPEPLRKWYPRGHNYASRSAALDTGKAAATSPPALRPRLPKPPTHGRDRTLDELGWTTLAENLSALDTHEASERALQSRLLEGHIQLGDLQQALVFARARLEDADAERAQRTIERVVSHQVVTRANRIVSSYRAYHYPGWRDSPWPRIGAMLAMARQHSGLSIAQWAEQFGSSSICVTELEHGGAYDPCFHADQAGRRPVDLREAASALLTRLRADGFYSPLAAEIEAGLNALREERNSPRELESYRRTMTASPFGSWQDTASQVFQARRRFRETLEAFSRRIGVTVEQAGSVERGGDPHSYEGYYRMRLVVDAVSAHIEAPLTDELDQHKAWLDERYLKSLRDAQSSLPGWADSGLPELGRTLTDSRIRQQLTPGRLAALTGRTRSDIERAEAGFADVRFKDTELAAEMLKVLGISAGAQEPHIPALRALRKYTAKLPPPEEGVVPIEKTDKLVELDPDLLHLTGRNALFEAPRAWSRTRYPWEANSTLTILGGSLPHDIERADGPGGNMVVYLRGSGLSNLAYNPQRSARLLREALRRMERGTLALHVLPADSDSALPQDFRIISNNKWNRVAFVDAEDIEIDIRSLLVNPDGTKKKTWEGLQLTPTLYADWLLETTELLVKRPEGQALGSERRFWAYQLSLLEETLAKPAPGRRGPVQPPHTRNPRHQAIHPMTLPTHMPKPVDHPGV